MNWIKTDVSLIFLLIYLSSLKYWNILHNYRIKEMPYCIIWYVRKSNIQLRIAAKNQLCQTQPGKENIIFAVLDWISFIQTFQVCNSFTWIISNLNFIAFLTRISILRMRKLCQFCAYKARCIGIKDQTSKPAILCIDHFILPLIVHSISTLWEWKFDVKACKTNDMLDFLLYIEAFYATWKFLENLIW